MNNIVFTCHRLANSERRIWIELAGPLCSKLVRRDGKPLSPSVPKEYVETEAWYDWNDEEFEDIKILDLGEVFSQGKGLFRAFWQANAEPRKLTSRILSIIELIYDKPTAR